MRSISRLFSSASSSILRRFCSKSSTESTTKEADTDFRLVLRTAPTPCPIGPTTYDVASITLWAKPSTAISPSAILYCRSVLSALPSVAAEVGETARRYSRTQTHEDVNSDLRDAVGRLCGQSDDIDVVVQGEDFFWTGSGYHLPGYDERSFEDWEEIEADESQHVLRQYRERSEKHNGTPKRAGLAQVSEVYEE